MRIELTDAMIAKDLAEAGMLSVGVGVLCILAAIIIFILSRKKPQILSKCTKLSVLLIIMGLLMFAKAKIHNQGSKEFRVVKTEVTNMYDKKYRSKGRRKYWVECYGLYKFKVSRNDYYNKYEIGDIIYVIVEAKDKDDVLCSYHTDEYEYVGIESAE